ncbi:MAG: TIGR03118 family protein [Flavisolibacter sp.]
MNRSMSKVFHLPLTGAAILFFSFFNQGCKKEAAPSSDQTINALTTQARKNPQLLKDFTQVNLVANNDEYGAAHVDPHLLNAWGIAFSATGIAWVGSQEGHVSTIYDRDGNMLAARPEVAIPSPGGATGGNPTGVVTNIDPNTADFQLSNGQAARFLFAGVDGIISGWNGAAGNNALVIANNSSTSAYTGITMAQNNGAYYLYAANFRAARIDVWDKDFNAVNMSFMDANIPWGYAPFNIQKVDDKLYVMYAKVGDDGEEDANPGNGYVDVYSTGGMLEKRFISRGQLNAPWGVAHAPASFFTDESGQSQEAILVGNLGDGRINAYSMNGKFLGQLRSHGNPIIIEGLWAISFPPATSTIDPNRLYFAAGPDDEEDGLFGYITK